MLFKNWPASAKNTYLDYYFSEHQKRLIPQKRQCIPWKWLFPAHTSIICPYMCTIYIKFLPQCMWGTPLQRLCLRLLHPLFCRSRRSIGTRKRFSRSSGSRAARSFPRIPARHVTLHPACACPRPLPVRAHVGDMTCLCPPPPSPDNQATALSNDHNSTNCPTRITLSSDRSTALQLLNQLII